MNKPKTRVDLWNAAKDLGFDQAGAIRILRQNGIDGKFEADKYFEYIAVLSTHSELITKMKIYVAPKEMVLPETCPVCGGVIEYDREADKTFGVLWGWKCLSDSNHFVQARWSRIKSYFIRECHEPETVGSAPEAIA